jgi:hypothetical protein
MGGISLGGAKMNCDAGAVGPAREFFEFDFSRGGASESQTRTDSHSAAGECA